MLTCTCRLSAEKTKTVCPKKSKKKSQTVPIKLKYWHKSKKRQKLCQKKSKKNLCLMGTAQPFKII